MRKALKQKDLGGVTRGAFVFAAALAFAGCTTNWTPGTGEPVVGASGASSLTRGSSGGTIGRLPASPVRASEDAAAILAAHQGFNGRVLGPVNPAPSASRGTDIVTGQFYPPSLIANPQITVNSSISSGPNPVISSGAGETGGAAIIAGATPGAVTAAATAAPATSGPTVSGTPLVGAGLGVSAPLPLTTPAAATSAPAVALGSAGIGLPSTQFNQVSVGTPLANVVVSPVSTQSRVRAVTSPTGGTRLGATSPPVVSGRARPVRMTNTNGSVIISNVSGSDAAAFASRVRASRAR